MHNLDSFVQCETRDGGEAAPSRQAEPDDNEPELGTQERATRSPIMQEFTWLHDRIYQCRSCEEKYPNSTRGRIKRPADGSTHPFWLHFKRIHPTAQVFLKEKEDSSRQTFITEGTDGNMEVQQPNKVPSRGLSPEETKDIITRFVCATRSPWSIVDHEAFKDLWRRATQMNIDPPSAKVIKAWAIEMHGRMKEDIINWFMYIRQVMLTADVWSPENNCGLLGVTAHWVDANWENRETVLALRELPEKDYGGALATVLYDVIKEFKLQAKVAVITTDNAFNNKTMIGILAKMLQYQNKSFTPRRHVPCFAHVVNIIVQAAVKTFNVQPTILVNEGIFEETKQCLDLQDSTKQVVHDVDARDEDNEGFDDDDSDADETEETIDVHPLTETTVVPHSVVTLGETVEKLRTLVRATRTGNRRRNRYEELCKELKMDNWHKLPLDCPTGWRSTYVMLDAALDKRLVLDAGASDFKRGRVETKISDDEWEQLRILSDILQPFAFAMDAASGSKRQTISIVFTAVEVLHKHLTKTENKIRKSRSLRINPNDRLSIANACKAMRTKLEAYRVVLGGNEVITSAAILDPYHKGKVLAEIWKAHAIRNIKSLLPPSPPQSSNEMSSASKRTKMTGGEWLQMHHRQHEMPQSRSLTPTEQLAAYLGDTIVDDGESVFAWWARKGQISYPALAPIARELLSISGLSAPVERMFSAGRAVAKYKQNRPTAESIEKFVTVKCWIRGHNQPWYDAVLEEDLDEIV